MSKKETYRIEDDNHKLFCMRTLDKNGNVILQGKNASINIIDLMKKALNPNSKNNDEN